MWTGTALVIVSGITQSGIFNALLQWCSISAACYIAIQLPLHQTTGNTLQRTCRTVFSWDVLELYTQTWMSAHELARCVCLTYSYDVQCSMTLAHIKLIGTCF